MVNIHEKVGNIHEKVGNLHEKVGNIHESEWREMAPVFFCICASEASLLYVHNNLMA